MKAIEFPQQTMVLAEDQPQYQNLPIFISPDEKRTMISCHELSDEELALIIKTKKIWQHQMTFGQSYHPTMLTIENPFDVVNQQDEEKVVMSNDEIKNRLNNLKEIEDECN